MNSVRRFLIGFAVCFVWLAASAPLQAQDADEGQSATQRFEVKYAQDRIADWTKQLDDIEKELDDNDVPSRLLVDGRSITERILEAARTLQGRASERLERIKAAKSKLGEAPAEGQSEVPAVAEERDRLNRDIANVSGVIKQIELSNFRATEKIGRAHV